MASLMSGFSFSLDFTAFLRVVLVGAVFFAAGIESEHFGNVDSFVARLRGVLDIVALLIGQKEKLCRLGTT